MAKKSRPSSKSKRKTVLVSNKGSAHIFDTDDVSLLEQAVLGREALKNATDAKLAKQLQEFLQQEKPKVEWIVKKSGLSIFRVVEAGRDPLSSKYTLAAGGRVNIGVAQETHNLPKLKAIEGVYASLDKLTAITEYTSGGLPMTKNSVVYELTNTTTHISLVDFDQATAFIASKLSTLSFLAIVSEIPFEAVWKYQKSPKASQIVGNWLVNSFREMNTECDGIIFSSTKNLTGKNIFILNLEQWSSKKVQ